MSKKKRRGDLHFLIIERQRKMKEKKRNKMAAGSDIWIRLPAVIPAMSAVSKGIRGLCII